jgi:hypothetical protein
MAVNSRCPSNFVYTFCSISDRVYIMHSLSSTSARAALAPGTPSAVQQDGALFGVRSVHVHVSDSNFCLCFFTR